MISLRQQVARLAVGLVLTVALLLPAYLLIGNLATVLPSSLALGIGIATLICAVIFGTRGLATKLSKR